MGPELLLKQKIPFEAFKPISLHIRHTNVCCIQKTPPYHCNKYILIKQSVLMQNAFANLEHTLDYQPDVASSLLKH